MWQRGWYTPHANLLYFTDQSSFWVGYSCEIAQLEVTSNIFSRLNEHKFALLVLLYLSNTLDTVDNGAFFHIFWSLRVI